MKTTFISLAAMTVFALTTLMLTSCGKMDQIAAQATGKPSNVCVDGVTYLQFTTGAALKVDRDGKPVPC